MPCVELGQAICLLQGGGDVFEIPGRGLYGGPEDPLVSGAFLLSAQAAGDAVTTFM